MDKGYTPDSKIDVKKPLRGNTGDNTQRPEKLKGTKVTGDDGRGSFTDKN